MRTEIGVHPWAKYFQPYLDGVELEDCTMADEEMGCAEVFADVKEVRPGVRQRLSSSRRMVFGKIELRPISDEDGDHVAARIKANPERAQEIWDEYYEAEFGAMDRELAASGWPRKPAPGPAPHRRHWISFDEMMSGLFMRGME